MPSFLKDLRRRSLASFHRDRDSSSKKSNGSGDTMPTTKSSSTLNSHAENSTAPTSHPPSLSNLMITKPDATTTQPHPAPQRPSPASVQSSLSKRSSMVGSFSGAMQPAPKVPQSLYAPRILSVGEGSLVHQKMILIHGTCGQDQKLLDGTVSITHHNESFPVTKWPVCASHFKALIHLGPGSNEIRLEFTSPKLVSYGGSSNAVHITYFRLNYLPLNNSPPLHLAIILGSDSPGTFDSTPEKIQSEGNDLQVAIRKFRMAGILWQAYTAEMMSRGGFGRRSFRFEEEWQTASLSRQQREAHDIRNEIKVHVVRSKRTVAEWRDMDVAQQYEKAGRKGDLFGYAADDLKGYFKPIEGQAYQVAALVLDTHWDTQARVIRGHAALGGDGGGIHLGLFGSHALHAYPSCMEDVVPALTNATRISRDFIGVEGHNDVGMSCWAAASSLGAHLHEVGHLFGCPHQADGIMAYDYEKIARSFLVREPFSLARQEPGLAPCLPEHEIGWHRLDLLRFRSHPCFRLVGDAPVSDEAGVQVWPTAGEELIVTARSGIAFVEIHVTGESFVQHHFEFAETSNGFLRQITLSRPKVQRQLPPHLRDRVLGIKVFSHGGGDYTVPDIAKALIKVKMPKSRTGFLGPTYGQAAMANNRPLELLFAHVVTKERFLRAVRIYHGTAVDGLEFCYDDGSAQLFGGRGSGRPAEFGLDTRRGEALAGFFIRAGFWIDGIEILTSFGRRSGVFGNIRGGKGVTLLPPRGYHLAGLRGSAGAWLDGFSLIITV